MPGAITGRRRRGTSRWARRQGSGSDRAPDPPRAAADKNSALRPVRDASEPHVDRTMKVVVVGAGILGASTAYHLARAGCEVTVIDRTDAGRATAAGAGIICPWGSPVEDAACYGLLAGGARYYPEFVAMLAADGEPDVGYATVGGLYVPAEARELDAVERRVRARGKTWPVGKVERLSAVQAQALFPPLRSEQPALYVSGGARVDGRRLARALQRACVRHGAQFETGSAELTVENHRAVGVRVGGQAIAAEIVVVAAGAWA
ncbi:MAG: FAD-binding oxidoreductase, partial [Hyphomicrobiaceae bacterium]|nr:FAD-binding oxidoreductase [Hyphomicrobiaceae bacterium]